MNKKILHGLCDTLIDYVDNIDTYALTKKQDGKPPLEIFAKHIAHIVNHAPVDTMRIQAVDVLNRLEEREELTDFPLIMNERIYNDAQRSLANSKSGKSGLDAFQL